jgi:hypothetical protein
VGLAQLAQGPEDQERTLIYYASLDWAVVVCWFRMGPKPIDGLPNVLAPDTGLARPPGVRRKAWQLPRRRCATPAPSQSASRSSPRRLACSTRHGALAGHLFVRSTALGAPTGLQARSQPRERRVALPPGSRGRDSRRRCDEVMRPALAPARRRTGRSPAHTHRRLHGDGEPRMILAPRTRRVAAASHAARLAVGQAQSVRGRALATAVPKPRAASPRAPGAAT